MKYKIFKWDVAELKIDKVIDCVLIGKCISIDYIYEKIHTVFKYSHTNFVKWVESEFSQYTEYVHYNDSYYINYEDGKNLMLYYLDAPLVTILLDVVCGSMVYDEPIPFITDDKFPDIIPSRRYKFDITKDVMLGDVVSSRILYQELFNYTRYTYQEFLNLIPVICKHYKEVNSDYLINMTDAISISQTMDELGSSKLVTEINKFMVGDVKVIDNIKLDSFERIRIGNSLPITIFRDPDIGLCVSAWTYFHKTYHRYNMNYNEWLDFVTINHTTNPNSKIKRNANDSLLSINMVKTIALIDFGMCTVRFTDTIDDLLPHMEMNLDEYYTTLNMFEVSRVDNGVDVLSLPVKNKRNFVIKRSPSGTIISVSKAITPKEVTKPVHKRLYKPTIYVSNIDTDLTVSSAVKRLDSMLTDKRIKSETISRRRLLRARLSRSDLTDVEYAKSIKDSRGNLT